MPLRHREVVGDSGRELHEAAPRRLVEQFQIDLRTLGEVLVEPDGVDRPASREEVLRELFGVDGR